MCLTANHDHMGETINLVEKVIFNCGDFNDLRNGVLLALIIRITIDHVASKKIISL